MLTVFDPFADMTRLRRQIERSVEDAMGPGDGQSTRVRRPAADLWEDENGFDLVLDLPGVDRESIDVQLTGEELTVKAERQWQRREEAACLHTERPHGEFVRVFRLGMPVEGDRVRAGYRDGVLTVHLPKAEAMKPRRVQVEADAA